ncbi:MAG TPA: anti-sigma regulatory factor [Candidatus Angelobacter sp.]|nr:anti-sigma regulatory factor [Candidatus Angelobacter sp.]
MSPFSTSEPEISIPIREECDVAMARKSVREAALRAKLALAAQEAIVIAVSEIARNIIVHAVEGEIRIRIVERQGGLGVEAVVNDNGPGIMDVGRALEDGYSTTNSLGLGLAGAKRLVDEFEIVSEYGSGTTVLLRKWST